MENSSRKRLMLLTFMVDGTKFKGCVPCLLLLRSHAQLEDLHVQYGLHGGSVEQTPPATGT